MITINHPGGPGNYDVLAAFRNDRGEVGLVLRRDTGLKAVACLYGDGLVCTFSVGTVPERAANGEFTYRRKAYFAVPPAEYDNQAYQDVLWVYWRDGHQDPTMFRDLYQC